MTQPQLEASAGEAGKGGLFPKARSCSGSGAWGWAPALPCLCRWQQPGRLGGSRVVSPSADHVTFPECPLPSHLRQALLVETGGGT